MVLWVRSLAAEVLVDAVGGASVAVLREVVVGRLMGVLVLADEGEV